MCLGEINYTKSTHFWKSSVNKVEMSKSIAFQLIKNSRYSLWSLNPSDDEVKTLRKEIDEDDNGELDFNEFCELMNSETLRWI